MVLLMTESGLMAIYTAMWVKEGIYRWVNGSRYEGDWNNNKRNGNGKMIGVDGKIYEGDFRDNKKDGFGTWV